MTFCLVGVNVEALIDADVCPRLGVTGGVTVLPYANGREFGGACDLEL